MVAAVFDLFQDRLSKIRLGNLTNWTGTSQLPKQLSSGLHCYDIGHGDRKRRIHLRVAADKSAVMFIDVTDVVHLNQSAAEITWMALEGIPQEVARKGLNRRYNALDRSQVNLDLNNLYKMVDSLGRQGEFCPSCSITGVSQAPLFSTPAKAPYKVDLALTYGCNNHCSHCYNEPSRYPMASLPEVSWIEVIDRLHDIGVPHLIFTGGEATLHPDLPHLVRYAESRGMITGLNTNGRRLSFAPYVEQLSSAGLNHVQITLASHHAEFHNNVMGARAFSQTVQGIRNAIDNGLHVITNTTLTQRNIRELPAFLDFIKGLGIRTFAMNGIIHSGGGQSNPDALRPDKLAPILTRVRDESRARNMRFLWYTPTDYCQFSPIETDIGVKRCNAGEYSMCVEPNGDVLPCQSYYVSAGNILTDSWDDIWNSELFLSFRQRESNPEAAGLPQKCWDCSEISICGGGCRLEHQALDAIDSESSSKGDAVPFQAIQVMDGMNRPLDHCYIPPAGAISTRGRGAGITSSNGPIGSNC